MTSHSTALFWFGAALLFAAPQGLVGQCPEGRIAAVFVNRREVFERPESGAAQRLAWAYDFANRVHTKTREDVIRRELLFREGDCYDAVLIADSERVLRATPFIARAEIFATREADGTVRVLVDTRDEWSTRPELRLETGGGLSLKALELREDNLAGTGQHVAIYTRESEGEREYGVSYATPQLARTRWDLQLAGGKTSAGYFVSQLLAYPFVGETGPWAIRQQFGYHDRFFEYFVPRQHGDGLARILFGERRSSFDAGAVYRFGPRRHLNLIGGALAAEWIQYDEGARFATREDSINAPAAVLERFPRQDTVQSIRAVAILGRRSIGFVQRRGIDAVNTTEDIPLGTEVEVALGMGLGIFGTDRDATVNIGLLTGGEYRGLLGGMRVVTEAKRNLESKGTGSEWSDMLTQLDAWSYWRPSPESRHTWVAAVSGVGGWQTTTPFQATLGRRSGLRGFQDHLFPGEQRVVIALEHRRYLPWSYVRFGELGTVMFANAGKIWQGRDPYGVNSPFEVAVGAGLRHAFPSGSRRTYRLDVAIPVAGDIPGRRIAIIAGVGQAIGIGALRDDSQLRRSARRPLASSLLSLPR